MKEHDSKKKASAGLKRAVALAYNPQKDAVPKVVGKGKGTMAEKIIQLAAERNIPIHKDPELLEMLDTIDFMKEIPPDMYAAVAEVLAFIYRLRVMNKESDE